MKREVFKRKVDAPHELLARILDAGVRISCAGDKIEKNEMGWACGAYG